MSVRHEAFARECVSDATIREVRETREAGEHIRQLHEAHDATEAEVLALVTDSLRSVFHLTLHQTTEEAAAELIAKIDELRGKDYISYMTFTPSRI